MLQSKTEYAYDLQGMMLSAKVTTYTSGTASRVELSTYKYDASGIRVSALLEIDSNADETYETRTKTEYLNDPQNETGYSQVLAETTTDATTSEIQKRVVYTIGLGRISQTTTTYSSGVPQSSETLTFGRDGHDSTRVLYNMLGSMATIGGVRQLFNYDSYGNAIGFNPSLAGTAFLYNCEQRDSTGLSYFRQRYYRPETGTFTTSDRFAGNINDPQSLHRHLFTPSDPINFNDPSGQFFDLLSGLVDELEFQADRAMAGLSALRNVFSLQKLVSIYETTVSAYAEIGFQAADLLVRAGPAIRTITTLSGVAFVTSTIELACEEFRLYHVLVILSSWWQCSGTLFTGGLALGEISNELRGVVAR